MQSVETLQNAVVLLVVDLLLLARQLCIEVLFDAF
jgi:hypothetical protein